ncbi:MULTISPECIES: hypothetical protein [unclassified Microcoleus]|uniref:hypothetical protein n=1 Tax=unclassified Microcoleus TaxID=2642155 RepID=UPI002FD5A85A
MGIPASNLKSKIAGFGLARIPAPGMILQYRSRMFGNAIALFAENRLPLFQELEYIKYRLSQVFLNHQNFR